MEHHETDTQGLATRVLFRGAERKAESLANDARKGSTRIGQPRGLGHSSRVKVLDNVRPWTEHPAPKR